MKVYVLMGLYDYGRHDVLGVFSSEEMALEASESDAEMISYYEEFEVEEVEIDSDVLKKWIF